MLNRIAAPGRAPRWGWLATVHSDLWMLCERACRDTRSSADARALSYAYSSPGSHAHAASRVWPGHYSRGARPRPATEV
eukprot:7187719-Prymnesium_polylepis.1